MAYSLLGKNYTPPDVLAKVTGRAKYAEDFRAEGMVFIKMLTSPMPHAVVRNLDVSSALKMPGVVGVLTADDVPPAEAPNEPMLTNEPHFVGAPILAVAAETEEQAADALEAIRIEFDPQPFSLDPLDSLYPGGENGRTGANTAQAPGPQQPLVLDEVKWTARDFAAAEEGQLPMGKPTMEWSYGDVEAGFSKAKLVLDESFVVGSNSHHSMEPRSCMSYWENGKCYVYGSSQSQSFMMLSLARMVGVDPKDLVFVAENCGGGFGSKGNPYITMALPAHMSKKVGRPCMLRITRAEEYYLGRARCGFQGRVKIGFAADGRITALDAFLVKDNGPHEGFPDLGGAGEALSLVYSPPAMHFRGVSAITNTSPRSAQRGPGQNQMACAVEPLLDKAANELGIDRVAMRQINSANKDTLVGPRREPVTSAYQNEALTKGAEKFGWKERLKRHGERNGSKVRAVGVGQAFHPAGFNGFDGLVRISPEGKLYIHTGVGNLGTYSHSTTARVAAEVLKCNWENCVVVRGDSRKHLPWNLGQFGSNTSFTMTRTNFAAATDALNKLKEIAALDLGGKPEDYDIANERVFNKQDASKSISYADAAKRAMELGGKFSGEEVPEDIFFLTKGATAGLAGSGLIGVAKDNMEKHGVVPAFAAGFIEIELDTETGKWEILDYLGVADCGKVLHPLGLSQQIRGGAVMGIGMAGLERMVYDPQNGLPANVGFYQSKIPSYLDLPSEMQWDAVDLPDSQNPVGSKGIGEPVMGCAGAALICAISEALNGHYFKRNPVLPDMIINAAAGKDQSTPSLAVHTQ